MSCKRNISEAEKQRISRMGQERMDLAKSLKEKDGGKMPWTHYVSEASKQLKASDKAVKPNKVGKTGSKSSKPKTATKKKGGITGFFQGLFCK